MYTTDHYTTVIFEISDSQIEYVFINIVRSSSDCIRAICSADTVFFSRIITVISRSDKSVVTLTDRYLILTYMIITLDI
jgi:hypothetical protein